MDKYLSTKISNISFISIIMVVYIHSYNLTTKFVSSTYSLQGINLNSFIQKFISEGIATIAVPLFFLISGYLFFYNFKPTINNFVIKYKRRFFSLVIPFMFWSIWGIVFFWIMQSMPLSKDFFTNDLVKNYSIAKIIDTIFVHPLPYQLWFLIDLIKYVIVTPVIYIYISKCSYYSLIPFLFLWFFDIKFIAASPEGILFFMIGCFFAIKHINLNNIMVKNKYKACIISFIWICIMLAETYLSFKFTYFAKYLHKISIIIGMLTVWIDYDFYASGQIKKTKIFKLTDFTFFIFVSHEPILTIIKKVMLKIIGVSLYTNLTIYLLSPILTIIISIAIGSLLRRYIKQFYRYITGGRDSQWIHVKSSPLEAIKS